MNYRTLFRRRTLGDDLLDAAKGLVAGMAGGLAGTWAMSQTSALVRRVARSRAGRRGQPGEKVREAPPRPNPSHNGHGQQEDPSVLLAVRVSRKVFGHELSEKEKKIAGPAVHYGFGAAVGGLYGAVADGWPAAATGSGLPFGAALWAATDEVALPLLRLSKPPTKIPISQHASLLGLHLIYGLTTELVRRAVRRWL